jgi:amino acid permease
MEDRKKRILRAISTLSGTIIGVGFFSLPYVLSKVGIFTLTFYFLFLGSLVTLIHLLFGELAILTPDLKRLPGFAKFHLGNLAEKISLISTTFGTYGTLLAYLVIGSDFLKKLFSPSFSEGSLIFPLFYFFFGSIFIFFGINPISRVEFLDSILFLLILILLFPLSGKFFKFENLFLNQKLKISNFFLPYGPILFSLWGLSMVPEIEEILKEKKEDLKKVIFVSILISAIFYLSFAILVAGISGTETSEDAISGLEKFFSKKILKLFYLFGTITTFTSFIAIGLTLEKVFWYDFKIDKNLSWFLTSLPPLTLFLVGFNKFLPIISFVGSVMLGIDGILVLLMYHKKLKTQKSKVKSLLVYFLILILLVGIVYEIIYFSK